MCVCGWQLIALAVFCQLLIIAYGEYEGRRRARALGTSPGQPPTAQLTAGPTSRRVPISRKGRSP